MKKMIVISQEEYEKLLSRFATAFMYQSKNYYGVSLILNETGEKLETFDEICGGLMLPWGEIFK